MMKKKFIIISSFIAFQFCVLATSQEERLLELERIACYEQSDVLDDIPEEIPSPDDMKKKYDISDVQLYQDILEMTKRYSVAATNSE